MWFRRTARNRKLSRNGVLDVKVRSRLGAGGPTRLVAMALAAAFGGLFGLYLLWRLGDWALNRLLYENPAFALRTIEVQTDGVLSPAQLRRWASVPAGANLLALDLGTVKRNLEYVPWIASVSVERVLPGTLRVQVTERRAVAQINQPRPRAGGGVEVAIYHLDRSGYVMLPLDARLRSTPVFQPEPPLPVIAGVNPNEVQPGRCIESPAARSALRLLAEFEQSPMVGLVELRKIDVGRAGVLEVTTGQGGVVTLGEADFERQLRRWREIHDAGARLQLTIASLDLAVTNNIPVRWAQGEPPPSAPAPAGKQTRRVNKHV